MSLAYYLIVSISLVIYYVFPQKHRWCVLLGTSILLYLEFSAFNWRGIFLFLLTALLSCFFGLVLQYMNESKAGEKMKLAMLIVSVTIVLLPLAFAKAVGIISPFVKGKTSFSVIAAVGISFYTLQIVAYLADVYHKKVTAQCNPAKYLLFVSFFPQIIQGPIPRYKELSCQFFQPYKPCLSDFTRAFELILWGWFLKMMIADKAGIIVNAVFDHYNYYSGAYYWVAGILYSIQLYTDFMACVLISKGIAGLYGIKLKDNFDHPYFSTSIRDFWRRWHMSLSSWLRDYVYIPLGGSRHGTFRKYVNLLITFLVSGIWHGDGIHFIFWGLLHGTYQIIGTMTEQYRQRILDRLGIFKDTLVWKLWKILSTFVLVMLAWVIFRADTLSQGLHMCRSMFTVFNIWIFSDDSLLNLGLNWRELNVLTLSCMILLAVSIIQEKYCIRDWIEKQHIIIRWTLVFGALTAILVFGTYGFGFDAASFIYGGF